MTISQSVMRFFFGNRFTIDDSARAGKSIY
jgi:hypothetical protein